MKSIFTIICLFGTIAMVGQRSLTVISNDNDSKRSASNEFKTSYDGGKIVIRNVDEIEVTGYDGTEIVLISPDMDSDESERSRGLKLWNSEGLDDNTGLGLSYSKSGKDITFSQISRSCSCDEYQLKVPATASIEYKHDSHSGDVIIINNISGEIEVSTNHNDVELIDITGPVAAKTAFGDIEAIFTQVSQKGAINLHSVHGFVDISVPSDTNANLNLNTTHGSIYTDLDIQMDKAKSSTENTRQVSYFGRSASNVTGKLGAGGVEINIKSSHDDLYVRKKI